MGWAEPGIIKLSTTTQSPDIYQLPYSNQALPGMSGGAILNATRELVGIHGRAEEYAQVRIADGKSIATRANLGMPISFIRHRCLLLPEQLGSHHWQHPNLLHLHH